MALERNICDTLNSPRYRIAKSENRFWIFLGCLVSSLEEARNDTAHDGNGRKAGYKINRYETTTQQHPTFWRPFAVVSAILFFRSISFSFFNFLPGRFFNLSFFLFVSAPWISSHYGRSTTATRAIFQHGRACKEISRCIQLFEYIFYFYLM